MEEIKIIDTNSDNILELGVCGYKNINTPGFLEKVEWLTERFGEGLKLKTLYSNKDKNQGMIEYIPGEYCWRPVEAKGYMFIHCIFVGFKKAYKNKGYASMLLNECLKDAKNENMYGVAVVTREGPFMAGNDLFLKNSFEIVDKAAPDFELLVKKFSKNSPTPKFKADMQKKLNSYSKGLTIIRADQCPYSVKNVKTIVETAERDYGIKANLVNLKNCKEAQSSPCAFGTFCIIFNGEIIAAHPISNTRFNNIMNKIKR
jgi:GNAT superfamily N-acetyltransferase